MAKHRFQQAGRFSMGKQIVPDGRHIKTIHKLGIQGREGALIDLNHMTFEICKAGILMYDNADIDSIKINKNNINTTEFLIIDFTYSDFED